jgi:hypothetical protein
MWSPGRRAFLKLLGGGSVAAGAVRASTEKEPRQPPKRSVSFEATPRLKLQPRSNLQVWIERINCWNYELIPAVMYDRVMEPPGTVLHGCIPMFATPVGYDESNHYWTSGAQAFRSEMKTFSKTNMYQCGQLPCPHRFFIRHMLFAVDPECHRDDLRSIERYAHWDLQIGHKIYGEGNFRLDRIQKAGEPLLPSRDLSEIGGIEIGQQQYFTFRILFDREVHLRQPLAGGVGLDLAVGLRGYQARAIQ